MRTVSLLDLSNSPSPTEVLPTAAGVEDLLIVGDCIEAMRLMPADTFDMVFADPPYNLQLQNELYRPNRTKVDAVEDEWDRFGDFAEYDRFTESWLTEVRRVMKPAATLWVIGTYHNIFRIGTILQDMGFWILNDVIWIKSNPCLLYTSPSPRDRTRSRMPSSA